MSQAERDRLVALKKAAKGLITRKQAAEELKISERQVYRLLAGMKERGDKVVIHRLRGQPSNRKLDEELEQKALEILRDSKLGDCGPTLASQYLAKKHKICVSKETMRRWMIACRPMAGSQTACPRGSPMAAPTGAFWRTGAVGHVSEHDWLESRGELSVSGDDDRRCHQPGVCAIRAAR